MGHDCTESKSVAHLEAGVKVFGSNDTGIGFQILRLHDYTTSISYRGWRMTYLFLEKCCRSKDKIFDENSRSPIPPSSDNSLVWRPQFTGS